MEVPTTLDLLERLWPFFFGVLGFVIWLIRLEGKVKNLHERQQDQTSSQEKMGTIENCLVSLQNDVKWLKERLNEVFNIFLKNNSKL